MDNEDILSLDPVVHAPNRLAILSILMTVDRASFMYLKGATGMKDGNLSTHLSKLEEAGYIMVKKSFIGKKPQTSCSLTREGRDAFLGYLDRMEKIVQARKRT